MGKAETRRLQAGRPLSPHLQVWRWHITMATSILNRMTGVALYAGAIGLAAWLIAGAVGPGAFGYAELLITSIFGRVVLFSLLFSLSFHTLNGIRHLTWDSGAGLTVKAANASGWLVLIVSFIVPIVIFAIAPLV